MTIADGNVTINLYKEGTNGKLVVTFDPAALTYEGMTSASVYYSVNDKEAADGKLVIAYAAAQAISEEEILANLNFSYAGEYVDTVVNVATEEHNENACLDENADVIVSNAPEKEPEVVAEGWSGYTISDDGMLTFTPSGQLENGQCNLRNYWKQGGVLNLPWGAYADMITTVVIEDGIHDIGQMAFYALPNLKNVVLGADVVEIRNYAFKNCVSLTSVTGTEGLEFIREGAFYGCSALKEMVIPEDCVIEDWAFSRSGVNP